MGRSLGAGWNFNGQAGQAKQRSGELAIFASCAVFPCMSILVKTIAGPWSGQFVSFFRFLVGLLLTVCFIAPWKQAFKIHDKKAWLLRGLFGSLAMLTGFLAIRLTSSGRAVLLANTYPVFVAIFGVLFFKEKITLNQLAALLVCFAGMVCVFYDHSHYSFTGNALALASGISAGFAVHFIKKARERNSVYSVYLSACLFGLLLCAGSAAEIKYAVSSRAWAMLLAVGLLAFLGQSLLAYGYKYVTASRGSIIGFAETLFTLLLSFVILSEEMKPRFWLGAALILAGLLINQQRSILKEKILEPLDSPIIVPNVFRNAIHPGSFPSLGAEEYPKPSAPCLPR
jgi:drug/metabolite transporter (DMT)-like permease